MVVTPQRDVIIVGGGHNGLVAAAYLARAGFDVLVAERNARVGGAVASAELTEAGVVHDVYATNMNLFLGSPAFAELGDDLARHGLAFATTDRPYASAFPGGKSLRVSGDADRTRELLAAHDPGDAAGWDALHGLYERYAPTLFELYGTPLPSAGALRLALRARRALGPGALAELGQLLLRSTRSLGDAYLASPEAKSLLAAWGMHLDFGPDVTGGAMFPFLELFTDMANGMSVVEGGASRLPEALAALVREAGSEVRPNSPVSRIVVERDRATGVELESGERIGARRAVIANLTPAVLFGGLVEPSAIPERFRRRVEAYEYGPGTMMVHAALSRPAPWEADELERFGYVHIGPYVEEMASTYAEAMNGLLPRSPLLVVGQTTAIDPTRAPSGTHVLWIQMRMLPGRIRGDAAGEIETASWEEARRPYAERVLDKLERYAPGVHEAIVGWTALSPADLERENPNLVGGDSLGGSHHLSQNALFRPIPGWSRYRTPVDRLYVVGAGTWPGAGVNAISGRLVAEIVAGRGRAKRKARAGAGLAAAGAAAAALAIRQRSLKSRGG